MSTSVLTKDHLSVLVYADGRLPAKWVKETLYKQLKPHNWSYRFLPTPPVAHLGLYVTNTSIRRTSLNEFRCLADKVSIPCLVLMGEEEYREEIGDQWSEDSNTPLEQVLIDLPSLKNTLDFYYDYPPELPNPPRRNGRLKRLVKRFYSKLTLKKVLIFVVAASITVYLYQSFSSDSDKRAFNVNELLLGSRSSEQSSNLGNNDNHDAIYDLDNGPDSSLRSKEPVFDNTASASTPDIETYGSANYLNTRNMTIGGIILGIVYFVGSRLIQFQ